MFYDAITNLDEFGLNRYDLEYAAIRSLTFVREHQEIEIVIDCPQVALFRKKCLHRLFFRFLGVSNVTGNLYEYIQNQLVEHAERMVEPFLEEASLNLHMPISHIRNVRQPETTHRFYIGAEDRTFEFTYQSGIFNQITLPA